MSTPTISTIIKMVESLPDELQKPITERLHEFIADLEDEARWESSFKKKHRIAWLKQPNALSKRLWRASQFQWIMTNYEVS